MKPFHVLNILSSCAKQEALKTPADTVWFTATIAH